MLRTSFVLTGLLFAAAPAFAQGEGEVTTPPPEETTTTPPTEATTATAPAASVSWWPQAAIDRPFVRGKGLYTGYAGLYLATITIPAAPPLTTTSTTVTGEGLMVGGAYGITDKINAGLQYAFALNDFEIMGPLTIFGTYEVKHDLKMTLGANAGFTLDLCGGRDPMSGDCKATKALHLGADFRYNLAPKMAVFSGAPIGPGPGGQLSISLEDQGAIDLGLPVGFAYQATPQIMAWARTSLATIHFNPPMGGDSVSFIFDAGIPFALGGIYALNKNIDVGGELDLVDLKNIGDFLLFNVFLRYNAI